MLSQPKTFKIYVAGSICELDRVQSIMDKLSKEGCSITHNWIAHEGNWEEPKSDEFKATVGMADVRGVEAADLMVSVLAHEAAHKGMWVEWGVAISNCIPIVVLAESDDKYKEVKDFVFYQAHARTESAFIVRTEDELVRQVSLLREVLV